MSSVLPKSVGQRKTSLDTEREQFEKRQTVALNKAINSQETPVKEKHARNTILGTFQDQGGHLFWAIASKMPVQANSIVCWKFLQMVHKVMRDGHPNVVRTSTRYSIQIQDLGKLWGHLKEGYGKLIACYCKLLVQKFKFHDKFRGIPGNLMMTDEQYYKICGADVNNYFEFSIDMLDYMDDILTLQHAVFGSLDMSRANSMTTSGQCRLAPLILCILDSCQLYDYLVKSLFHLHSSLPPDTLFGHRDRFLVCYKKLKEFYHKCSNLQYFKHLVQVPHLPEDPPNFLVASDFTKHIKPAAVVKEEEPEPEVEDVIEEPLIDMSMPQTASEPPPPAVQEVDERDFLIERLQQEIRQLKEEIARVRSEDHRIISGLREELSRLEKILSELRISADQSLKENEELKKNLDPLKGDAEAAEKQAKANQEKFQKMKDIYGKLREEHVTLLRNHDTNSKQLTALKKSLEEKEQVIKESELEVSRMVEEKKMVQDNLQKSADDVSQQLAEVSSFNSKLEKQKEDLESRLQSLEDSKSSVEHELANKTSELNATSAQLRDLQDSASEKESELSEARDRLQRELEQAKADGDNTQSRLECELSDARKKNEEKEASWAQLEADMVNKLSSLSDRCDQLEQDKSGLRSQIDAWMKRLLAQSTDEAMKMLQDAIDQGDNPAHTSSTCTAEYLLLRANTVLDQINQAKSLPNITTDIEVVENVVSQVTCVSYHLSECVVRGFATSHAAQIEPGEELANECRTAGKAGIEWLKNVANGATGLSSLEAVESSVKRMIEMADGLLPKMEDVKAEEIGNMLENEMAGMTEAIEAAAAKIQGMLDKSRQDNTGVNLEVNENILGSCTELMKAIKILVEKSRDLQREIVESGRGTTSFAEFYKKNHRWTEGLLSAAKAVGWGATTLLDTADRVVSGQGKFEEIMACANEIAASTAQLVVSSKVKAERGSKLLAELGSASKGVNQATGNVVASAKAAAKTVEDQSLMDFSSISLHQTKKLEMQCQIRVMELECNLEKERVKLGELRKQHYTLAAASEVNENGEFNALGEDSIPQEENHIDEADSFFCSVEKMINRWNTRKCSLPRVHFSKEQGRPNFKMVT